MYSSLICLSILIPPSLLAGVQVLIVGMVDGFIFIRSCVTMKILFMINSSFCHTRTIWSMVDLGQSCFCTGSDEGSVIVWRINEPLIE